MEHELGRGAEALPGLLWTALPDGQIRALNQHWCDYTGLALDEPYGRGGQAAVHPEDLAGLLASWQDFSASIRPVEADARLRGSDGTYRWYLFVAHPSRDAAGRIVKWRGFGLDIDDRKRAEDGLRESAARFRDYADTASDWLF